MKDNFEQCLAFLLKEEGGFVNNPKDPGGMTNLGVTKKTWEAYVGHEVDEATMRALGPNDVAPLYKSRYWDAVKGDDLPSGLDYAVFDFCVNSGPRTAAKNLQRVAGAKDDGSIGPSTMAQIQSQNPVDLITNLCDNRLAFLQSLETWPTFGKGWGARVDRVKDRAIKMAG